MHVWISKQIHQFGILAAMLRYSSHDPRPGAATTDGNSIQKKVCLTSNHLDGTEKSSFLSLNDRLGQIDEHDSGTESDGVIDVEDKFSKFDIGEFESLGNVCKMNVSLPDPLAAGSVEHKSLPSYSSCSSSASRYFLDVVTSSSCLMYDHHSSEEELEVINGSNIDDKVDELSESLFEIEPFKSPSTSSSSTINESRKRSIAQSSDDEVIHSPCRRFGDERSMNFCSISSTGAQLLGGSAGSGRQLPHIAAARSAEAPSRLNRLPADDSSGSGRLRTRARGHQDIRGRRRALQGCPIG